MPYRLPIDRVFFVDGFGTVVTGAPIEGAITVGDAAAIMPDGVECRVRNLQVHGKDVPTAYAGQCVAINLAGVKKTDITCGDTIAKPGSVCVSLMLDVRLENLKNSGRTITNGSQLHLYHGYAVRLAKVVLLDRDALQSGESCYAQLRLTEEIATREGDRFVVRFYLPLETIDAGAILDDNPRRHKRNNMLVLQQLAVRESGSDDEKQKVASYGISMPECKMLAVALTMDVDELAEALANLSASGRLLSALAHEGKIKKVADRYALADFSVHLTKRQNVLREKLWQLYRKQGLEVENVDDIYAQFERNELPDCKQVLESMVTDGDLVMLMPQLCIHKKV